MEIKKIQEEEKSLAQKLAMEVFLNSDGLGFSEQGMHSVFSFIEEEGKKLEYFGAYEKELVGILAYAPSQYHLALCFVRQEAQGKGIGHQLLETFLEDAKKEGIARVTVNAAPSAKTLYEEFGFEVCGEENEVDGVQSIPMEYLLDSSQLGRQVTIVIEHPYGSYHEQLPDVLYPCNCGYVEEVMKEEGRFQDAYLVGVEEPVDTYQGNVIAIVYRRHDMVSRWVIAKDTSIAKQEVIETIGFQEQFDDTRILWYEK